MTREEAKDKWLLHIDWDSICKGIDDVYDVLDTEICENCSYGSDANDDEGELIYCDEIGIEMSKTFGCVYFQEKEKK